MDALDGANFGAARDWIGSDKPWWQVTPYDLIDNMLAGGVKQFDDIIAKDPLLGSIDQMWIANPLRKVVPVDWAEITRALRTVWLHSLRKPEKAMASGAELYMTLWRSTMDIWNEAGQRWWDMAGTDQSQGPAPAPSDKRFAAPEWQQQPDLPHPQGVVPAGLGLAAETGRNRGHGRGGAAAPEFPPAPVRRCHEPGAAVGV